MNIGHLDSSHVIAFETVCGCGDLCASNPWNNQFGDINYDFPLIFLDTLLPCISSTLL